MHKERKSVSRVRDEETEKGESGRRACLEFQTQKRSCGFWSCLWLVDALARTPPAHSLVCSPQERVSYSNKRV